MATMAALINRLLTPRRSVEETFAAEHTQSRAAAGAYRLRSFPNDDVFFFSKRHDNARVVREADPAAERVCLKTIAAASAATALLIGVLIPGALGLVAGYRVQKLEDEQRRLAEQHRVATSQESALLSSERLQYLADLQQYTEPAAKNVHYLRPAADSVVADSSAGRR